MGLIDSICHFATHVTSNDFSGEFRDTRFKMEEFLRNQRSDITDEELLAMFGDGIKLEEIYYQLQTQYNCYEVLARKTNLFRSLFDEKGDPKLKFPDESYFFQDDADHNKIDRHESEQDTDEIYAGKIKQLIAEKKEENIDPADMVAEYDEEEDDDRDDDF